MRRLAKLLIISTFLGVLVAGWFQVPDFPWGLELLAIFWAAAYAYWIGGRVPNPRPPYRRGARPGPSRAPHCGVCGEPVEVQVLLWREPAIELNRPCGCVLGARSVLRRRAS